MAAISDLFSNKLFLQYLAAAGQDIGSGNPIGTNVNAVTSQTISTQNYANLMKQLLSGQVPGGKLTADDKGVKMHFPTNPSPLAFTNNPLFPNPGAADLSAMLGGGEMPAAPTPAPATPAKQEGAINPFALGQLDFSTSPSDLAGLTPEMLSSAVGMGMQNRKDIMTALLQGDAAEVDRLYKEALTIQALATAEHTLTPEVKSTDLIRNYEYAKRQGYPGTLAEFKIDDETGNWHDYLKAKEGGYDKNFHSWMLEMKKAGAGSTNIYQNDPRGRARESALGGAEARPVEFFSGPEFPKAMSDFTSSKEFKRALAKVDEDQEEKTGWNLRVEKVEDLISNQGGEVLSVNWADGGKTLVYTVKWNDKTTSEVRYAAGKRPY